MKEEYYISRYVTKYELDIEMMIKDFKGYVLTIIQNNSKGVLSKEDQEEIISDVFLSIWHNKKKIDNSKPLKNYIAGITKNIIRNKFKEIKNDNFNVELQEEQIEDTTNMDIIYEREQINQAITEELNGMKKDEYEVFTKYYYCSESIKEIAEELGLSEGNVKVKLHRIRKKLKKNLQKRGITYKILSIVLVLFMITGVVFAKDIVNFVQEVINNNNKIENVVEDKTEEYENKYSKTTGDRFVKIGNIAVFADDIYDNKLYIFDIENNSVKEITNLEYPLDKLYFDGEYIYGLPNSYMARGIYKINLNGDIEKIYNETVVQMWIQNDEIYFVKQEGRDEINQTPQGDLCVMDKDGKNITTVIKNVKNYFKIYNNYIYYIDWNTRSLCKATLEGKENEVLATGRCYITKVTDKYVTYIDYADGEKHKVVYLENNENHELGRFGNLVHTDDDSGYVFTRKTHGSNSNIDDGYTLFEIDGDAKTEKEILYEDEPALIFMNYIYNNTAYLRGENQFLKISLESKNKEDESDKTAYKFYIAGKSYNLVREGIDLKKLEIKELETGEKIDIEK